MKNWFKKQNKEIISIEPSVDKYPSLASSIAEERKGRSNFFKESFGSKLKREIRNALTKGFYIGDRNINFKEEALTTIDYAISQVLNDYKQQARTSYEQSAVTQRIINLGINNVVGSDGFKLQFIIKNNDGKVNHELSQIVKNEFKNWSKSKNCSYDGIDSFLNIQKIVEKNLWVDGEFLFRKIISKPTKDNPYGYQLESLDTARLSADCNFADFTKNTYIRMGVEIDRRNKRPVAYHILKSGNLNYNFQSYSGNDYEVIPAEHIVFGFSKLDAEQTRGITQLHTVLHNLKNLDTANKATLQAVMLSASSCVFMKKAPGQKAEDFSDEVQENGDLMFDIVPGMIMCLEDGSEITSHAPVFPEAAHAIYLKGVKNEIAGAVGLSPITLNLDTSEANYSVGRILTLEEREMYKTRQSFMIEKFLNVVFEDFLEYAMLNGKIIYNNQKLYTFDKFGDVDYKFVGRTWEWLDPTKEVEAKRKSFGLGITTLTDMLQEQGTDIYEIKAKMDIDKEVLGEDMYNAIFNSVNNIQKPNGTKVE